MVTKEEIIKILDKLETSNADNFESEELDFKQWEDDIKDNQCIAIEMSVCFVNAKGGTIVFGVKDKTIGRKKAIRGCKNCNVSTFKNAIYNATQPNITVEVEELTVPEGTLLLVHVPQGKPDAVYGTSAGLYKIRVGKECRGLSPSQYKQSRMSLGVIDWSAEPVSEIAINDLDQLEISRYRNTLRAMKPESDLLKLSDEDLLKAVRAIENGKICYAGLLMFGRKEVIESVMPQHEVIFLAYKSPTEILFKENFKQSVISILNRLVDLINTPENNPQETIKLGLFQIPVPDFPEETFREAILNSIVHRDYTQQGSVYVRLEKRELHISNPGGFIGGITPQNILHQEARQRNRRLAEIIEKSGLVERAGIGRRRIFIPMLSFGRRIPVYETNGHSVILKLFGGSFNRSVASFISQQTKQGRHFEIDELILISYLSQHPSVDVKTAFLLCQRNETEIREVLDTLSNPPNNVIEQRGKKRGVTYHLCRDIAIHILGASAYSQIRDIDEVRFPEMIRAYVTDHGSISNSEMRELLRLGNSHYAKIKATRLLNRLSRENGFLERQGKSKKSIRYMIKKR